MSKHVSQTFVIKLGGAALVDKAHLAGFFKLLESFKAQTNNAVVLVHGGGLFVDALTQKLGFSVSKKNGLRVTPSDQIEYITGALAGTANKVLQAQAKAQGVTSLGICVSDLNLCQVTQLDPELGCVGKVSANDPSLVQGLLDQGVLPIISSIGLGDNGEMFNINADDAAVAVASALNAKLVLLSDVAGVLDANKELIPALDEAQTEQLIQDGVIKDGMQVKVKSALDAAKQIGQVVTIASWQDLDQILKVLQGQPLGTSFSY